VAVVATCAAWGTAPDAGAHFADFQKVDELLDAAEQSIRQSFESAPERAIDRRLSAVSDLIANWTINSARDLAWNNCLMLWAVRNEVVPRQLLLDGLAAGAAMASPLLLVAI
jgi:Family of unknown function (DUF5995)